jgi:hypothetical protein
MSQHERTDSPSARAPEEQLPQELLWAEGGHASDVVLTALADGQHAIVPSSVRMHVERCAVCMTHLGHAALLSLHAGTQLAARAEHDRLRDTERRPLPRLAIGLGFAFAFLGLVPNLLDSRSESAAAAALVTRAAPVFVKELGTVFRQINAPGAFGLVLTYGTAALLVCMGLAVVRLLPKKEASR